MSAIINFMEVVMTEQEYGKYKDKRENKRRIQVRCPYCNRAFRSKVEVALHMMCCKEAQ